MKMMTWKVLSGHSVYDMQSSLRKSALRAARARSSQRLVPRTSHSYATAGSPRSRGHTSGSATSQPASVSSRSSTSIKPVNNTPSRLTAAAAEPDLAEQRRSNLRKVRGAVYAVAAVAIVASGAWLGASLKTASQDKEARKKRFEATPDERIAQLESVKYRLLSAKEDVEGKMRRLEERKAAKAKRQEMKREMETVQKRDTG
ncbi:MAG: hypothetical protein M1828_002642 [Chrysothrix sp. TS-e1954]|nr:MAG: hypothetical protein M1828_002642 [Chrysothrix sp. TS-e1954]